MSLTCGAVVAVPLSQVLGPFTRTGGFYARSWGNYLDRQPGELPVARPTIALAAQAFRDEIVLAGVSLAALGPPAMRPHSTGSIAR